MDGFEEWNDAVISARVVFLIAEGLAIFIDIPGRLPIKMISKQVKIGWALVIRIRFMRYVCPTLLKLHLHHSITFLNASWSHVLSYFLLVNPLLRTSMRSHPVPSSNTSTSVLHKSAHENGQKISSSIISGQLLCTA
jgi:hypothetical protein